MCATIFNPATHASTQLPSVGGSSGHAVQFYQDDQFLLEAVSRFVGTALAAGDSAVVIATPEHRAGIDDRLKECGVDVAKATQQGRYIALDAETALSSFIKNGGIDRTLIKESVGALLTKARGAGRKAGRVAVFGEMVNILWATGQHQNALQLEQLWNELAHEHTFSLLCAYPLASFSNPRHTEQFLKICEEHSAVLPAEGYAAVPDDDERLRRITELQQRTLALEDELALRNSEERFRLFVEAVRDYAMFMLDINGCIATWNAGAERIKGYKASEIIGKHLSVFYPEEDLRNRKPWYELEVAAVEGRFEDEGWRIRKDGSRFWANVIITALRDSSGKLYGFGKVTRDFTERMRTERALQEANRNLQDEVTARIQAEKRLQKSEQSLRKLSAHLLRSQDEERRRIGRDLHDSLGQYLAILKMNLDSLYSTLKLTDAEEFQFSQCSRLAEDAIKEVRTLSYLLYPPMLEELGLKSAIPWYLEGFSKRSRIETKFEMTPDFPRLSRDVELTLFRILQEALTNVHRHAVSKLAIVRLRHQDGNAVMEVEDQGKGFPDRIVTGFTDGLPGNLGVGLRGMDERTRQLGGRLELVRASNAGAVVRAVIPAQTVAAIPVVVPNLADKSSGDKI
jgi:PAS domain S-box-containing protein